MSSGYLHGKSDRHTFNKDSITCSINSCITLNYGEIGEDVDGGTTYGSKVIPLVVILGFILKDGVLSYGHGPGGPSRVLRFSNVLSNDPSGVSQSSLLGFDFHVKSK